MSTRKRVPMRRAKRKPRSTAVVARQALTLAKKANKHELKYLDTNESATLMTPSGVYMWDTITSLPQGTANNQREGNVVHGKSLDLKFTALYNPLATASNQLFRIIIFQNTNSGIPSNTTDYLQSVFFYSHKSIDNRFNTVTLYDRVHEVSADHAQKQVNIKLPLKRKMIPYGNSSTAPEKNNVSVLVISNEPIGLESPFLSGQARFYFTDP